MKNAELKLIMLRGIPASGKSTWAKDFVSKQPAGTWKRINKDELRGMLDAGKWTGGNEKTILEVRDTLVASFLAAGKSVIVDDTNFAPVHEARLRQLADAAGAAFEVKGFEVDLDEAISRDLKRPNGVGADVIKRMFYQALPKPELNKSGRSAVIFDLDGTLAEITGRSPYDASKCGQDLLRENVAWLVGAARAAGDAIIFVSGRSSAHRSETVAWLDRHLSFDYALLMRPEGDSRKDWIVKKEIFERDINPHFTVRLVVDDRDQVVDMWRAIGLECWQVAPGNF